MPNAHYPKGLAAFAKGEVVWKAAGGTDIRTILVDTASYTYNAAHGNLSDVAGGARVGSAVALTLIDAADGGVLDANDISFTSLVAAPSIEALVIYKHTGTEATSTLLMYIDTATGLPAAAAATQLDVQWSNGADKIGRI